MRSEEEIKEEIEKLAERVKEAVLQGKQTGTVTHIYKVKALKWVLGEEEPE